MLYDLIDSFPTIFIVLIYDFDPQFDRILIEFLKWIFTKFFPKV